MSGIEEALGIGGGGAAGGGAGAGLAAGGSGLTTGTAGGLATSAAVPSAAGFGAGAVGTGTVLAPEATGAVGAGTVLAPGATAGIGALPGGGTLLGAGGTGGGIGSTLANALGPFGTLAKAGDAAAPYIGPHPISTLGNTASAYKMLRDQLKQPQTPMLPARAPAPQMTAPQLGIGGGNQMMTPAQRLAMVGGGR